LRPHRAKRILSIMLLIGIGVVLLAFFGWVFTVAIRRDLHGRGVESHGSFDCEQSRAESQSRVYTGH
jgi:hypothetical protein